MKWIKRGLLILLAAAVVAVVAYGFVPQPVDVDIAAVATGDLIVTVDQEAVTRVRDRYAVVAPLAAHISRITLKVGDGVDAGDVVATVTPPPPAPLDARARAETNARIAAAQSRLESATALVKAAEAEFEFAQEDLRRARRLFEGRHVSQEAVDAARTREQAAEARLDSAKSNRDAAQHDLEMARAALLIVENGDGAPTTISLRAPVSGRVLRVHRESAGAVMMGEPLLEIGDPASLEVVADLLSRDAARIKPGLRARFERWGGEEALRGRVRLIEPSGFTKTSALGVEEQRVNVLLDFADEPEKWRSLGDGFRVEARIILTERPNTLKVPSGAVFNTEDGPAVFVVADGIARLTQIRAGVRTGLEVEILGGVSEGDVVIVHPGDAVRDNVKVALPSGQ